MIKDISKIREYLEGYVEVELPYEFIKGSPIQYITCEYDEEGNISCDSFFPNCIFLRRCNDIILLESNKLTKRVPIYKRDKEGNIIYQSRFFIKEEVDELKECVKDYEPEKVSAICGIDAETIKNVARLYAKAKRALIFWGMGVSQHTHGTDTD